MRVMVIVKGDKNSEAGILPKKELFAEMGKFNEQLAKAGVMLAGEGLQPTSKGKRVKFSGATRTVIDGPFYRGIKGTHRRILAVAGPIYGRSG